MRYWQVRAKWENGSAMAFGVAAPSRGEAQLRALERLPSSPHELAVSEIVTGQDRTDA